MRGQGPNGVGTQEDFSRWKPDDKQDWLTITELGRYVGRDPSWIRYEERHGRLPIAPRVKVGRLFIRLYSPAQADEILSIFRARDEARMTRSKQSQKKLKRKGRKVAR